MAHGMSQSGTGFRNRSQGSLQIKGRCLKAFPFPSLWSHGPGQKVSTGVASAAASTTSPHLPTARGALPISDLYTSQTYKHRRRLGNVHLEVVPGKGLGWRASRDIATGELLIASLPIAVLYGPLGEPPDNEELAAALRQSWPRLTSLERRWLSLLADCCAASNVGRQRPRLERPAAATSSPVTGALSSSSVPVDSPFWPASAPPCDRLEPEALLLRARALVIEGWQDDGGAVQGEQQHTDGLLQASREGNTVDVDGSGPSPAAQVSGPRATAGVARPLVAAATPGLPPASGAELQILPPAIFGSAGFGGDGEISSSGASGSSSSSSSGGGGGDGMVADLLRRYSYVEASDDPVLTELLDLAAPVSCAGIWPEMALLNHSCCPNASVLLVGSALYVRAARPVLEGEEVTVSYLGTGVFRDVAERRSRLRASHGFLCTCPRCNMEQHHFPTRRYAEELERPHRQQQQQDQDHQGRSASESSQGSGGQTQSSGSSSSNGSSRGGGAAVLDDALLTASLMGQRGGGPLQALLDALFGPGRFRTAAAPDHALLRRLNEQLLSELEAAAHAALTAASRPRQQQAELLARLEGLLEQVEDVCSYLQLPRRGRAMVLASVYGLVRLTSDLSELSQRASPERRLQLLQLAAEALEAVAPGSDAHVAAAVKVAGVARRVHGAEAAATRRAELDAASAHLARYGRELLSDPALLRRLTATRRRLATGSGLAASMGVLAWLEHVGPG